MSLQLALSSFAIFSSPELAVLQAGLLAMIRPISIDKNYISSLICVALMVWVSLVHSLSLYIDTHILISVLYMARIRSILSLQYIRVTIR